MVKSIVKTRAEQQFAAVLKKDKQVIKEKEKARQEISDRMARLRALRLAKEEADRESAAAEKAAPKKSAKTKKNARLPEVHRRQT